MRQRYAVVEVCSIRCGGSSSMKKRIIKILFVKHLRKYAHSIGEHLARRLSNVDKKFREIKTSLGTRQQHPFKERIGIGYLFDRFAYENIA